MNFNTGEKAAAMRYPAGEKGDAPFIELMSQAMKLPGMESRIGE
jgi:hypothetical protein